MNDDPLTELAQRASLAADKQWPGASVSGLAHLPGGHSGLTLSATLTRPALPPTTIVLKAPPPGRPARGRHDVLRQARVFELLAEHPGVPVPGVLFTLDESSEPLVGMEWCPGECVEPVLDAAQSPRPSPLIHARALTSARVLAALHGCPVDEVLAAGERVEGVTDELDRWSQTMAAVPEELRAGAQRVEDKLRSDIPTESGPCIVHGDYRLGNILFDGDRPTALIDWEIWSVTDPRVDLGWFLTFCDPDCFPGIGTAADGMPDLAVMLEEYEAAAPRRLPDMAWFNAFGRYKMAAIMGHNLRRHREGRYHDPFQEQLPDTIAALVGSALALLR